MPCVQSLVRVHALRGIDRPDRIACAIEEEDRKLRAVAPGNRIVRPRRHPAAAFPSLPRLRGKDLFHRGTVRHTRRAPVAEHLGRVRSAARMPVQTLDVVERLPARIRRAGAALEAGIGEEVRHDRGRARDRKPRDKKERQPNATHASDTSSAAPVSPADNAPSRTLQDPA